MFPVCRESSYMANSRGHTMFAEISTNTDDGRICSAWPEHLGRMNERLSDVAGTTEDEFLAIGAKLHEFYRRAGEISEMSTDMAGQVAGEEIRQAIKGLQEITARMGDYLTRKEQETEKSSQTLKNILQLLDNAAGPLSGFKKINKSLRMLGISTKIESARLGQSAAGFETLANDVTQLSVQVSDKAGTILEQKDSLSAVIQQTLAQVLNVGGEQRKQVRGILDKTRLSLAALTDVNERCSSAAAAISAASTEVSQNIGEVVTSMQFHDIVRQQIEHVAEALDDLCGRLNAYGTGHGALSAEENVAVKQAEDAGTVCELQSAQLRHSGAELETAVWRIVENLREIAAKEARMSEDTRKMAGVADQTGSSFLTEMKDDLAVVATVLGKSSETNRTLAAAMNTVVETVGEIAGFVGDIENVGEEIELIALNAQVKAALTGEEGAALGVLAEAIQRLSVDAIMQTSAVSETLKLITEVTDGLCSSVNADASELDVEVHEMVDSLAGLLKSLQNVNENLGCCLSTMKEMVQSLSTDIENATTGITAHHKVAEVLNEVVEDLSGVIGEARRLVPSGFRSERAESLLRLADRYTMQSERKIHASILNGGSVVTPAAGAIVPAGEKSADMQSGEADGFGDNVELF